MSRSNFFQRSLHRLAAAADRGFEVLEKQCIEEQLHYEVWPVVRKCGSHDVGRLQNCPSHKYSLSIMPLSVKRDYIPLCSGADGNCLYRSVSTLCFGSEDLHIELRARTTCELVINKQYYLQPEILGALDIEGNTRILPYCSPNFGLRKHDINFSLAENVFKLDCLETPKLHSYSQMWHIHALSSVLKQYIFSVYPETNPRIRMAFNRNVLPRTSVACSCKIAVMWTRIGPMPQESIWQPNHFVPLIPKLSSADICGQNTIIPCPQTIGHAHRQDAKPSKHKGEELCITPTKRFRCNEPHQSNSSSNFNPQEKSQQNHLTHGGKICNPSKLQLSLPIQQLLCKQPQASVVSNNGPEHSVPNSPPPIIEQASLSSTESRANNNSSSIASIIINVLNAKTKPCKGEGIEKFFSSSTSSPASQFPHHDPEPICKMKDLLKPTSSPPPTRIHSPLQSNITSKADPDIVSVIKVMNANERKLLSCGSKSIEKFFQSSNSHLEVSSSSNPFQPSSSDPMTPLLDPMPLPPSSPEPPSLPSGPEPPPSSPEPLSPPSSPEPLSPPPSPEPLSPPSSPEPPSLPSSPEPPSLPSSPEPLPPSPSPEPLSLSPPPSGPYLLKKMSFEYPIPNMSCEWYEAQGKLFSANFARSEKRQLFPATYHANELFSLKRCEANGSLRDSVQSLQQSIEDIEAQGTLSPPQAKKLSQLKSILAVGKLITEGTIVSTQEAGLVYKPNRDHSVTSATLYETFSKYLNIMQIYIHGKAYLIENRDFNVSRLQEAINQSVSESKVVNARVEERVKAIYKDILEFSTHRGRQTARGIISLITSTKFASKLEGVQSRKGSRNALSKLGKNLQQYHNIKATSQIVRNDLTTEQQYRVTQRIISARKLKEIRTIASGRGRKLKCEEYPGIAEALEKAFGESNSGLESHPRLTTGTLYRPADCATTMKEARMMLLALAPANFTISLSSCYNYTENYRKGSYQAKRHHEGRNVNANISLKLPPRIGVEQLVVNLHWTTANVNHLLDSCTSDHDVCISKDAKAIVPANIQPVQHPGHSWNSRLIYPDHTWDQSRTFAVTPMTFLFMEPFISPQSSLHMKPSESETIYITRTGQPVTFINLSFFEQGTTFKCLNETLLLLTKPSLDNFFRDTFNGGLKKKLLFIVDNGPSEHPSSPLVKMCLVRLLKFLKLNKVVQTSFAEYHSKRNYVERVHAEENRVLAKHGPFSSSLVHKNAKVGSREHEENMEAMAKEVQSCISRGSFGGHAMQCYRGITRRNYVFNDEESLNTFLSLTEERKEMYPNKDYSCNQSSSLLEDLQLVWNIDSSKFHGNYIDDYRMMTNGNEECDHITAWTDKYTSVIYSDDKCEQSMQFHEKQPLPDYVRWSKTGELHYLNHHDRQNLNEGMWDQLPGLFIPSNILDLCFEIFPSDITSNMTHSIAVLAWVPVQLVEEYFSKQKSKIQDTLANDILREKWMKHKLYCLKKKELESKCKEMNLQFHSTMAKHELVQLIAKESKEPSVPSPILYHGKLASVPTTLSSIAKMQISKLRAILFHHGISPLGCKESLTLRVYHLRQGKTCQIYSHHERKIRELAKLSTQIALSELKLNCHSSTRFSRKYSSRIQYNNKLHVPEHISVECEWTDLHKPLLDILQSLREKRQHYDENSTLHLKQNVIEHNDNDHLQQITEIGAVLKIQWTKEDIGETGWRPGWYTAIVQSYQQDDDTIEVTYPSEPGCVYTTELTNMIDAGKIKLQQAVL